MDSPDPDVRRAWTGGIAAGVLAALLATVAVCAPWMLVALGHERVAEPLILATPFVPQGVGLLVIVAAAVATVARADRSRTAPEDAVRRGATLGGRVGLAGGLVGGALGVGLVIVGTIGMVAWVNPDNLWRTDIEDLAWLAVLLLLLLGWTLGWALVTLVASVIASSIVAMFGREGAL